MPDIHPIQSDESQSATARNPVIHPNPTPRIGSFPDSWTSWFHPIAAPFTATRERRREPIHPADTLLKQKS